MLCDVVWNCSSKIRWKSGGGSLVFLLSFFNTHLLLCSCRFSVCSVCLTDRHNACAYSATHRALFLFLFIIKWLNINVINKISCAIYLISCCAFVFSLSQNKIELLCTVHTVYRALMVEDRGVDEWCVFSDLFLISIKFVHYIKLDFCTLPHSISVCVCVCMCVNIAQKIAIQHALKWGTKDHNNVSFLCIFLLFVG